jgi:hypothetical protein
LARRKRSASVSSAALMSPSLSRSSTCMASPAGGSTRPMKC